MGRIDVERVPYEDYSNRQLIAVPLAILAVAIGVLALAYLLTGTPVALGFDFTGGTTVQFTADDASAGDIRDDLSGFETESVRSIGFGNDYEVETQLEETDELESAIEDRYGDDAIQSVETRSAKFGGDTQREALVGVVVAFLGMSVLVALIFRSLVPSVAVVASAFSDIVVPLALMRVFGIELSLGAVAALLMIIGYSVDSDILLNNHVLKRHGEFYDSAYRAMRTGVSMTLTSVAAMVTMAIVSRLLGIPLLDDVALILTFGLVTDLLNTYMLNISLLRWYKYEGVKR
ncbi:protein translocase subunit secF [Halovenus aranensis]|jgi:preprotein translocase subunit SecF|uniref:Protein-export membrane protein SecF n=1 Tax=Halovenus aranensis TaxID=890420 RepID=A0A1G8YV29_9EURY|nr:protein translocase subunit SecF [Halovenus aranensis]SDK06643.1 protein translocase subunit secF [Halovenus aranensis]